MLMLAKLFAIDILGFAVMSNHYHIVLQVNVSETIHWTDSDIANKWLALNPRKHESQTSRDTRKLMIMNSPARCHVLRDRLGSLSWFMRYLNEPLARMANIEDGCKGHFWEGRFKSQRLLDEHAILAAMVYVDLNPARAGTTKDIVDGKYTSLAHRLALNSDADKPMTVISKPHKLIPISLTLTQYIQLARWTVDIQQSKRPTSFKGIPPTHLWIHHYLPAPGHWQRAIGSVQSLKDYAKDLGQCWIKTRTSGLLI